MNNLKTCKACNYFELLEGNSRIEKISSGVCKYNAPFISEQYSATAQWPVVNVNDWCGKFAN